MRTQIWFNTLLLIALLFIATGDSFLPQPLNGISKNVRKTINKAMIDWVITEDNKDVKEAKDKGIIQPEKKKEKILQSPGEFFDRALEEAERQTNAIEEPSPSRR